MDLALLLKLAAPPVSISVAVQNIVVMLAIVVVGMLCYLLIENFIEVCPDLACVNVYYVVEKDVLSFFYLKWLSGFIAEPRP